MRLRLLNIFLILLIFLQSPASVYAFGCKKPIIDYHEKISYVNIDWWDNFSDPYLKCYIIQAIQNNHDARRASWQVEEYRQNVKLQFSHELPSLTVGGDYILNHLPDSLVKTKTSIFAVPFYSYYEADVFLKNHDKTKSTKKAYEASKFQEKSIYISLASDVTTSYINIIKFDKQIELQRKLVEVKKQTLCRVEERYSRGVVSAVTLNNAKKDYQTAQNSLDEFIKSRDKALTQMAVLIGESPNNIPDIKRGCFDDFEYKTQIPCAISSDVIFSRPDIMEAEANLEKANIDVRVARKDFLPRFNIVGLYSLTNLGPDGFGTWGSTVAALFAGVSLDLFKGGAKFAALRINKARYEQMFESYRQTDLNAIKEVNDSLVVIYEDTKTDNNTVSNLVIQKDNYHRSDESYKRGTISYTDLLSQCEQLLNVNQNQVNSKTNRLIDYISLYKAVGGKL